MEQNTSLSRNQLVRFRDSSVYFQTVNFNGMECLCMEDIQRRFPSVTVLCIDNIQLSFLRDDQGNYLTPLRIKARPDYIIEAVEPVSKSNDTIHALFGQIDAKMQEMDKKTDLILANSQEMLGRLKHVMTQMYELHEYTTPRYFFILPSKHHDWRAFNAVYNLFSLRYKLFFLCECSDEPSKLHIAPHDGYAIKSPSDFIATYGSYLRTTINIARTILSIGGFIIDHAGSASNLPVTALPPLVKQRTNYEEMNTQLDVVENMLNQPNDKLVHIDSSMVQKVVLPEIPLQGAQLRELQAFLDLVDNNHSLGNLFRIVTDDGHVRWVCHEHYNAIGYNSKMSEYIRQLESIGGKYDRETKEVILTGNLTNKIITMISEALTKGLTMFTFVLQNCSVETTDLAILFDTIINRSSIHRLVMIKLEVHKWMGMSKYICEHLIVSFQNQSLKVHFASDCPREDVKILIRLLRQNKICRALHFFGYDLIKRNSDLVKYLKENQELTTLVIHHLMNIEFIHEIITFNSTLRRLKLTFWFNSSSILFSLCQIMGQNKTLVDLDLMDHTSMDSKTATNELLTILRQHPSMKYLRLHVFNVQPTNANESSLIDVLLNEKFLSHLRLSDSCISNQFIQAITHACEETHVLVHLELFNCHLNEENQAQLQSLYTKGSLTHLNISEQSYWSMAFVEIREQIKTEFPQYRNVKLEQEIVRSHLYSSICLDKMELIDHDMEIVVQEAIVNKQCKLLSLQSNKITSIGAAILAEALTMETLNLENNYISDDGVECLVHALSSNKNQTMKTLVLQKNKITDKGAKYLAQMLENNQTLTWLYLGENEISNEGVRMICAAIATHNQTLEMLVLSSNKLLNDLAVDYLLSMIENNQSLKKLWIDDCNLTETGKRKLEKTQESKKDFYVRA